MGVAIDSVATIASSERDCSRQKTALDLSQSGCLFFEQISIIRGSALINQSFVLLHLRMAPGGSAEVVVS